MNLIFTNIQHAFRKANRLTCNEYVLADMIYQLCTYPESDIKGWCYMSRVNMADELGVSKQTILNLIDGLITKGFIEKNATTNFLRTSKNWNIGRFTNGKESLPEIKKVDNDGKESLPLAGKESLPNNYIIDNNINNVNSETTLFSLPKATKKEEPIYREFKHLKLLNTDFLKLKDLGFTVAQIDRILDGIENYAKNKNYTSLYLTAKKWLEKEYPNNQQADEVGEVAERWGAPGL